MKTAVVILNWNGIDFLKKFLPTLIENTQFADIVVVDNLSTDNSLDYLKENYPSIALVCNAENGGFAKGYNDGLEVLKNRFDAYLLLNSDIEVTPNWLSPLIKKLEEDPKIVAVQPKILSYNRKTYFEHAGASGGYIDKNFYPFCRGRIFSELEEDLDQYDNEKEVFWTSGACMLVRANIFHELGGFDEDFFAHMEEIDFCWRSKKMGYSLYVVPSSKVYHVGGGTLSYENPRKTYLNFRNNLYMIHKNYEGWLFGKIFYRLILDGLAAIQFLLKFKFNNFTAVWKAHYAYYKSIKQLNRKRKYLKSVSGKFNPNGLYRGSILWAFYFKRIKKFSNLNHRFFDFY